MSNLSPSYAAELQSSIFAPPSQLSSAVAACEQALQSGQLATACQTLGNLLQGLGRFQEAVNWHTLAQQPQPDPARVYANLGRLCIREQQWQQAILYYEQALKINPQPELYRQLANLYSRQDQRELAADYRYQVVKLRPDWATGRNQLKLGNLLLEVNRFTEAVECYQRSVQLEPKLFQAYYNLAVAYTSRDQWAAAAAAYQQALEINPNHADSYYGLCKVAEQQQDLQAALQYCQQAVELSPNSFATCYTLGTLFLKLDRWDEATAAYRQALELNPEFAWSYHNLGYALLRQGDPVEAITKLQQAAKLLPDSPWTHYHLAEALSQTQAWDQAILSLLLAIQVEADLPGVYYKLGAMVRQRLRLGLEDSIAYYQKTLPPNGKPQTEFYAKIAERLEAINQVDGAFLFYRLALHLQPRHAALYEKLKQVWGKREQIYQQLVKLQRSIAENPDHIWLYTDLGNLLANQGDTEQAVAVHRHVANQRGWQRAISQGYVFTHDWFTHTIPVWTSYLKQFVDVEINALEIGSFEGMSTCWLLDYILTHANAKLTCIDLYFQALFDTNIAKTGSPAKVIKLTGDSHQLLATLEPESYDLIYIDGNHLAEHARQDAALSWRLLKAGGLLVFDDYQWSDPNYPGQETKLGIDAFLASVQAEAEVIYQDYQMIVRKTSTG